MPRGMSRPKFPAALLGALAILTGQSLAGPALIEETDARYLPTSAERSVIAGIVGRFMEK